MKSAATWSTVVIAFMLLLLPVARGGEVVESSDFADFAARARKKAAAHGKANVLLVFDNDNTLLAMNQSLGSDQWFLWQEAMLGAGKPEDALVAKDFTGLLAAQGLLFLLGHMHPPQPDAAAIVGKLQSDGFAMLVLTSRGYDFRDATERELSRNGFHFDKTAPGPRGGYAGTFLPYDHARLGEAGLTAQEASTFGLGAARPVSYMNGIFMGSGQHKGVMLRSLLKKVGGNYKSILFIDDMKKHVDRMQQAYAGRKEELVTVRYGREDANVKAFDASDKKDVMKSWKALETAINTALPGGL